MAFKTQSWHDEAQTGLANVDGISVWPEVYNSTSVFILRW